MLAIRLMLLFLDISHWWLTSSIPHFPHIFLAPSGWNGLSRIAPYFHILSMEMAAFMDKVQFLVGLSIKMAVFMDGVCKNRLLSTKSVVSVDGMWKCRDFGLKGSITWCKCGAKPKRKIANPWKLKICDLKCTRSRGRNNKFN